MTGPLELRAQPDVPRSLPLQWTVLHEAVMRDSRKIIKILLKASPNPVEKTDAWGRTPLFLAQDGDTIRLLIDSGADRHASYKLIVCARPNHSFSRACFQIGSQWFTRQFAEEKIKGEEHILTTLTDEEIGFAMEYLKWHANRNKELADQYEANKRKIADKASEITKSKIESG